MTTLFVLIGLAGVGAFVFLLGRELFSRANAPGGDATPPEHYKTSSA